VSADRQQFPWSAASATGVGSWPGIDPREAIAVILGELPDFPHLPELPARGPGADMIGRTAGLLVDLPVQTTAGGWRLGARSGRDSGRAAGFLSADLDAIEEAAAGYSGLFKVQACGPWTLAASLELTNSVQPALADPGAVADLTGSLAEGLAAYVAAVRSRLPGATILLQLDEPALPAVLAGSVPTASGLHRLSPVDDSVAADTLRTVLTAATAPTVVHCCAPEIPFSCIKKCGALAVSFDLALFRRTDEDAFGEAVESGLGMFIGAIPAAAPPKTQRPDEEGRIPATEIIDRWLRIGLPPASLIDQVVITPACGLAGASPGYARAALTRCQSAARLMPEMLEERVP
jgi:hypothetical protein